MKVGYSPLSILDQLCGSVAVASVSPITAGVAAGVVTFVNAIFDSIETKGKKRVYELILPVR